MYGTNRQTELTHHERNLIGVAMASESKSVAEIAEDFDISRRTVRRIGADALKDPAGAADRAELEYQYRSQVYIIVTDREEREEMEREREGRFVNPRSMKTKERWYPEPPPGRERRRRTRRTKASDKGS